MHATPRIAPQPRLHSIPKCSRSDPSGLVQLTLSVMLTHDGYDPVRWASRSPEATDRHHEDWRGLPLRPDHLRGGDRPWACRDLSLYRLPDAIGVGLPHVCSRPKRWFSTPHGTAEDLRQDRRKRCEANPSILSW